MTLGEVINKKYKIVANLGFGSATTIWCCRNLATNKYAALKLFPHDLVAEDEIDNETAIYKHLTTGNLNHDGKISRPAFQRHIEPPDISPDRKFPEAMLKQILIHLLLALDFLHSEFHIIHTDIKEENILLTLVDSSIVEQLDTEEIATPSLYKNVDGYNLYRTANFGIPTIYGRPILCDFSLARNRQVEHCHDIQPDPYRAPEVILEMP